MGMISLEQALEIAKRYKENIDRCCEYEDAYMFSCTKDAPSFGGESTPVVVMKEDGKVVNQLWYYTNMKSDPDKMIDHKL